MCILIFKPVSVGCLPPPVSAGSFHAKDIEADYSAQRNAPELEYNKVCVKVQCIIIYALSLSLVLCMLTSESMHKIYPSIPLSPSLSACLSVCLSPSLSSVV